MNFGERLKKLCQDYQYTQNTLEEITGIDRSTISAYELGTRKPSIENLETLARVFKVSIDYLYCNSNKHFLDITNISETNYYKIIAIIKEEDLNFEKDTRLFNK
ncbi:MULTISPECIES: helix-turn-helix domain-containing protein [Erysipelotrichaceae]|jgi:DNA-binding helix-turn-helix protein|uniref:HTH cro/C1-type domain-containing protein n=2 Tax=Erysipelotrichaceae TaxID=128827 RepID=A0A1Y4SWJ6_9FIRM|nr:MULTISPECIES: helix-turn-helix transcriptional regulator [Erysipelotrichaceae]OUQ33331.1 hypothetical protein B5E75_10505 [Massilimicrobiota timonensis]UTY39481.1 helix-turn-helix domain-containing protein [Allocoprobacillus halotolerans]